MRDAVVVAMPLVTCSAGAGAASGLAQHDAVLWYPVWW